MNKRTRIFIENFIRDYAKKDIEFGYDLATDCDLSQDQQSELINGLIEFDKESVREVILDYGQKLIDERIQLVLTQDRYEKGLIKRIDPVNGEIKITSVGGF